MSCLYQNEDQIDVLLDYSAGRLDAARTAILEKHLAECDACAAFQLGQREIWQALDEYAAPPVSMDFNRGVWRKIDAAEAEPWYRNLARGLREGAWKPVFPIVGAALLVVAGFVFDHQGGQTSSAVATVTVAEAEQVQNTLEDLQLLQNLNASAAEVVVPVL